MKNIFSVKDKIIVAVLAVLIIGSTVSTVLTGIRMNTPPTVDAPPIKDDGVVSLEDIQETETDYENVNFADKIQDGVLTLSACGATADSLVDYGPLIRSAIRTAVENPGTVLEFQPGTYYAAPVSSTDDTHTFDFSDYEVQNLHIKGNGCTLILLDNFLGCFNFSYSDGITIENMTVDCLEPPTMQGTVTAFDASSQIAIVQTDRVYTMMDDPRLAERLTSTEANGTIRNRNNPYLLKENCMNYYFCNSVEKISDTEYKLFLNPQTANLTNNFIEVGDKITLNNRRNTNTFIFDFRYSGTTTLKDITIYNSPGGGVLGLQNDGVLTMQNFQMIPDIRKGLWTCGTADGLHVQGSRGKVIMEDCLFSHLTDDAVNLYQWCGDVPQVLSETELVVDTIRSPLQVGDRLEIIEPATGRLLGVSKIKDMLLVEGHRIDRRAKAVLETPIAGLQAGAPAGTYYWYTKEKSFVGTEIRDCVFQYNRGRGLVLCTTDTVVEGCTFDTTSNYAVQGWFNGTEGYELQNFVFKNNTLRNCNYLTREVDNGKNGMLQISTDNNAWQQSVYLTHSNIEITGNKFIDYHGCAVGLGNCRNVTMTNNSFDLKDASNSYSKNNAVYISYSDGVVIKDNRFLDDKPGLTAAIRYRADTVEDLVIQDNSFSCDEAYEVIKE